MNRGIFRKFLIIILALLINTAILTDTASAQRRQQTNAIPEDDRPSTSLPWFVGIVLSAGAVVVGLKNSKRTHLD